MNHVTKQFLRQLFKIGAVKIDTEKGFKLALHEKNPHAPLSPIYLNLRTPDNPKSGPLGKSEVDSIAIILAELIVKSRVRFDAISGIPRAGTPFAKATLKHLKVLGQEPPLGLIPVKKRVSESDEDKRLMTVEAKHRNENPRVRPRILLIDDLITKAITKVRAMEAFDRAGYKVIGVAAFVDREQGGTGELKKAGLTVLTQLTLRDIVKFYAEDGLITRDAEKKILDYLSQK